MSGADAHPGPTSASIVVEHPLWAGQGIAKAHARADPELGEHLAQVPFDGARAEEELGRRSRGFDRPSRASRAICASCGGELVARVDACACAPSRPWPAARGGRARRTPRMPIAANIVVGGAQLLARVDAPALAAQPLAVEQVRAGELRPQPGPAEPVDRLAVQRGRRPRRRSAARGRGPRCPAPSRCASPRVRSREPFQQRGGSAASPVRAAASTSSGTTNGAEPEMIRARRPPRAASSASS